ncbi:hypothetical protein I4U23_004144 [Adineta vaga]|nr:hypothetical protein I4U23_004144 [Adineta vaga]
MPIFINDLFELLKKLVIFILIVAIAIPLYYGSTNPTYLTIRVLHSILSLKHTILPDPARAPVSAGYHAFQDLIRMNPIAEFDRTADPLTMIKEQRAAFAASEILPKLSSCKINKEVFEYNGHTVDAYWINNHQNKFQRKSDKIILYFHGGGYMLGDIHSYERFECHLSHLFNTTFLHVEYRLCPEYPMPAAVEDTVALYRALLRENILPSQLIIMGDSAGGGLSLLSIQALITQGLPIPHGLIALSPMVDLSASGESYKRNRLTDIMVSPDNSEWMIRQVLGPNHSQLSPKSPIFSPLFGSFKGFPPMYINVGTAELLEDEGRLVVKKAQEAGVDVTLEEGLYMMHIYPIFFLYYPEARNTLDNINKWIQTN